MLFSKKFMERDSRYRSNHERLPIEFVILSEAKDLLLVAGVKKVT